MTENKHVSYVRASTQQQGRSGLGMEAQQAAVLAYLQGAPLIAEFVEVETGKGADALEKRPQLRAALALCKKTGATLVIAKLDRLARNVHFISGLIETGVDFVCADMPQANKVMLQMYSVMAEWERDQISARTKSALAAAKARGVQLGVKGADNLRPNVEARQQAADDYAIKMAPVVKGLQAQGMSQRAMATALTDLGVKTPSGKTAWAQRQVALLLARIAETTTAAQ